MDVTQQIADAATLYGVDPALAIEVATAESGLNPNVSDSAAGAVGLFQLMPATAASLGVDPRDPQQNITGGVMYLQQMLARFGDVREALAAYNWGPTNVSNAVAQFGSDFLSHAPGETQNYVARILGNLGSQYQVSVAPTIDASNSFRAGVSASLAPSGFTSWLLLGAIAAFALWAFDEARG